MITKINVTKMNYVDHVVRLLCGLHMHMPLVHRYQQLCMRRSYSSYMARQKAKGT